MRVVWKCELNHGNYVTTLIESTAYSCSSGGRNSLRDVTPLRPLFHGTLGADDFGGLINFPYVFLEYSRQTLNCNQSNLYIAIQIDWQKISKTRRPNKTQLSLTSFRKLRNVQWRRGQLHNYNSLNWQKSELKPEDCLVVIPLDYKTKELILDLIKSWPKMPRRI